MFVKLKLVKKSINFPTCLSICLVHEQLVDLLMDLWPEAVLHQGAKASQCVDLAGYMLLKTASLDSGMRLKCFVKRHRALQVAEFAAHQPSAREHVRDGGEPGRFAPVSIWTLSRASCATTWTRR